MKYIRLIPKTSNGNTVLLKYINEMKKLSFREKFVLSIMRKYVIEEFFEDPPFLLVTIKEEIKNSKVLRESIIKKLREVMYKYGACDEDFSIEVF